MKRVVKIRRGKEKITLIENQRNALNGAAVSADRSFVVDSGTEQEHTSVFITTATIATTIVTARGATASHRPTLETKHSMGRTQTEKALSSISFSLDIYARRQETEQSVKHPTHVSSFTHSN